MEKEKTFRTTIGGQALIEGILMRGPEKQAIVVRGPEGLVGKGVKALMFSADYFPEEDLGEPSRFEQWLDRKLGNERMEKIVIALSVVMAVGFSLLLFMFIPTLLSGLVETYLTDSTVVRNVVDAVLRLAIFMTYMILVSRMKDIKRVFAYHGAEHKTIFCYEKGLPLTVENVRIQPKHHPRCGTSFLFVVIVVAVLFHSVIFALWPVSNAFARIGIQLLLLPLVVGVTYEFNRYVGGHDNPLTSFLARPGMWMQNFTTNEPDDSMIEVAIEAMKLVIPAEKGKDKW